MKKSAPPNAFRQSDFLGVEKNQQSQLVDALNKLSSTVAEVQNALRPTVDTSIGDEGGGVAAQPSLKTEPPPVAAVSPPVGSADLASSP